MRVKILLKFIGVILIYLWVHLYLPGCATTSDEEIEELDATTENVEEDVADTSTTETESENTITENAPTTSDTEDELANTNVLNNMDTQQIDQSEFDTSNTDTQQADQSESYNNAISSNVSSDIQSNTTQQDLQNIVSQQGGEEIQATTTSQELNSSSPTTPTTNPIAIAAALPELGSKMPYIVQAGDTISKIAMKIYNNPNRWEEIAKLSSLDNPNKIYPGDVVYYQLTPETLSFATQYESLPKAEIIVTQGDTLSKLAEQRTGSWMNWKILWRHTDNIDNPDQINVGQVVYCLDINVMNASNNNNLNNNSFAQQINLEIKQDNINNISKIIKTTFDFIMLDLYS